KYLHDRFVLREDNFLEAERYDGETDAVTGNTSDIQNLPEEEETLISQIVHLTPLQILKHMQEFDSRQHSFKAGEQIEFNFHSQDEAIKSGKEVYSRLDVEKTGHVSWKAVAKVLSKEMSKGLYLEIKPYLVRIHRR